MAKARVILVEDERIVALHLKQQISKLDYDVVGVAASGQQALNLIKDLRPDVVLMDIHIEGKIDGIETAAQIPEDLYVALIYLTAFSEEATLERARATRPYGYLLKPFSERELHATIQMALERRRADAVLRESAKGLEALVKARTAELEAQTKERVKAEQALMQAQKLEALGQLTGSVAHDFNNLLMAINGALHLLDKRLEPDHVGRRYVDLAREATGRGARVANQLLAFSHAQRLELRPTEVCAVLRAALPMFAHALGPAISLKLDLHAEEAWAMTATDQLELAVMNLALNARDAMPDGGSVSLGVAVEAPAGQAAFLQLWLSDTGQGMSADVSASALEPFFTTKERGKGTGLGLAQVHAFARQCGGEVIIESAPGAGATVRITMPLMASQPAQTPSESGEPLEPAGVIDGAGGMRLLLVDDDEAVRQVMADGLRMEGFEVFEAADGASGLALFEQEWPDALVLDFAMPGMNGAEVARRARAARPDVPLAFCSGYADSLALEGVDDALILRKPIAMTALGRAMANLLRPAAKP